MWKMNMALERISKKVFKQLLSTNGTGLRRVYHNPNFKNEASNGESKFRDSGWTIVLLQ